MYNYMDVDIEMIYDVIESNMITQKEENVFNEDDVIELLVMLIEEKRINNYLKKEVKCLTEILLPFNSISPLVMYTKENLIMDITLKDNVIKSIVPDDKVELIYYLDGDNGKKKRKRKNEKANQKRFLDSKSKKY